MLDAYYFVCVNGDDVFEKSIDNLVNMPIFEITPYCGSWRVTNQYI